LNKVDIPRDVEVLATQVVDAAVCVHRELGPGLLESVYEGCFTHELESRGVKSKQQIPVPVFYRGKQIDMGFRADVIVEGKLLVELKAVEQIIPIHKAQTITYLKVLMFPLGLLINFNEVLIKNGIHRVLNVQKREG
jgi:GxxExxY protein